MGSAVSWQVDVPDFCPAEHSAAHVRVCKAARRDKAITVVTAGGGIFSLAWISEVVNVPEGPPLRACILYQDCKV